MEWIYLFAAGSITGVVVWLSSAAKHATLKARAQWLQAENERLQQQMTEERARAADERKEAVQQAANEAREQRKQTEAHHQQQMQLLQQRFDEAMQLSAQRLQTATEEMLRNRQKEFAESSKERIGQVVAPLQEGLQQMRTIIQENSTKQTALSSEMRTHLEHLMRHSEAAQRSADELARALKHGTKMQGDWGETILEELLTSQGLTPGIHFDVQPTLRHADGTVIQNTTGQRMRPDVVLHLDHQRDVVIDAKVSLTAFVDYVNAENEVERMRHLHRHIDSLNKHVKELAAKRYTDYVLPPKLCADYVIMFVPHSGALHCALNAQPELWRRAMEQNVFIADEQSLYAALRMVHLTWRQILQAQNHEKVYELANEMLHRVGLFYKEYEAMGGQLRKAVEAHERGLKKITEGGMSINTTAHKLLELGAKQDERNPLLPNE